MVTEKKTLVKMAELLGRATKKPTIIIPVATTTLTMPHISLLVQSQRVPVPPVSSPVPSQRVPVSQPTPHHRVQKEVSTPKP